MSIEIVPFTSAETPLVLQFNERMRAAAAAVDFLLPTRPSPAAQPTRRVSQTQLLALDETRAVRGGILRVDFDAVVGGRDLRVSNYQAPLSEAVVDTRFSAVAVHFLKYIQRHSPDAFFVGMGQPDRPLPRVLAAAGWTIRPVPFLFRPVRLSRLLDQLPILRARSWAASLATLGARTGAAAVGGQALRLLRARGALAARGCEIERVREWGDWADRLWSETRSSYAFAVKRDREAVSQMYPVDSDRYIAYLVRRGRDVVGWVVGVMTPMRAHPHFGNLTVSTVLDAVALPDAATAVAYLGARRLADGADLVVTNQSHERWIGSFRQCGFLSGPSNFLLATSKPLSEAIASAGERRVHVGRGDGDGRIHL